MTDQTPEQTRAWLDEVQQRCDAATPGPWNACREGKCSCKLVWSKTVDCPVATIQAGEWGDSYAAIQVVDGEPKAYIDKAVYGLIPQEDGEANAVFIAHAREDMPKLIALTRQLQERNTILQQSRWHHSPDAPQEHFCEDCDSQVKTINQLQERVKDLENKVGSGQGTTQFNLTLRTENRMLSRQIGKLQERVKELEAETETV